MSNEFHTAVSVVLILPSSVTTALRKVSLMLPKLQYAIHLKFIGAPNVGYSSITCKSGC